VHSCIRAFSGEAFEGLAAGGDSKVRRPGDREGSSSAG
jgi:hypothetical protein